MSEAFPVRIPRRPEEAISLAEWREWKLGLPQKEIARRAGCAQPRISSLELGKNKRPPRRRFWSQLQHAYEIENEHEFERLLLAPWRLRALTISGMSSAPLLMAPAAEPGETVRLSVEHREYREHQKEQAG